VPELPAARKRHYASHNTHNTQNCFSPPALEKQLGLKMAIEKGPMPAIVIDHIEEKAADN
jgi:uncharacterized protein (TIGR03435 family)